MILFEAETINKTEGRACSRLYQWGSPRSFIILVFFAPALLPPHQLASPFQATIDKRLTHTTQSSQRSDTGRPDTEDKYLTCGLNIGEQDPGEEPPLGC